MGALLAILLFVSLCRAFPATQDKRHGIIPDSQQQINQRKLHGRFLHITDFHPDPFYKTYSSASGDATCHRGTGSAGFYGAETSDCDSPLSLVNATFQWIEENLKDSVDFVIWTGDSARHDNDEEIPRNDGQIINQNEMIADKFFGVFRKPDNINDTDPTNDLSIPIVPTFGNNDVLPHNIFEKGPNRWTTRYLEIWRRFIPEEQRHQFQRGGWYHVEVIPGKLAVFSLNTLYFFESNSAVDGCASKKEPGYEQFEWLRIQLQFMRERGMKAILMGHVPPARTENKKSWDETCWQKYTLWMRQYRDVIVAQLFGHMNINHFMFQDFHDIDKDVARGIASETHTRLANLNDDVGIASATDYLIDLRHAWAKFPSISSLQTKDSLWNTLSLFSTHQSKNIRNQKAKNDKIGGPWGERYSMSHVASSVVPNYLPTLRIFEYNITGVETHHQTDTLFQNIARLSSQTALLGESSPSEEDAIEEEISMLEMITATMKKNKKKKKKHKFKVPTPPSKVSPPGPAYSPQTFSLLGYTHYFANITHINNDSVNGHKVEDDVEEWKKSYNADRHLSGVHKKPHPKKFTFKEEYSTLNKDDVFALKDLTMRNYLNLAHRIGAKAVGKASEVSVAHRITSSISQTKLEKDKHDYRLTGKKKGKKGKGDKSTQRTKEWFTFVRRAFVETVDPTTIESRDAIAETGK